MSFYNKYYKPRIDKITLVGSNTRRKNQISKTGEEDTRLIRSFGEKMTAEMQPFEPKKENIEL
ncbi:MAG: hypothetical protein LBE36_08750 [Flavobacteriaceae bacterium]|jgi:hypothetical protein|nr:hypothetical protein [Flavobacteriaceae bacterium]